MEILWTGLIGSIQSGDIRLWGFTNLWMFFIYGSAVFLEPLHDLMSGWKWPARGIIWVVVIWGMEYTSGLFLSNILGTIPWVYSGPFSFQGLIRLDFAPAWFVAGLLFERAHLALDRYAIGANVPK